MAPTPWSPAAVLAARVALSLAILAAPALTVQHSARLRSTKEGQAVAALSMVCYREREREMGGGIMLVCINCRPPHPSF